MRVCGICLLACLVVGCGGHGAAQKKRLEELSDKVLILQNERDRLEERVGALEARQQAAMASPQDQGLLTRPPLKVVRLQPSAPAPRAAKSAEAASPPAGGEVVRISGTGTAVSASGESGTPVPPGQSPTAPPLRGAAKKGLAQ